MSPASKPMQDYAALEQSELLAIVQRQNKLIKNRDQLIHAQRLHIE